MLVKPLLYLAHQEYSYYYRYNVSLIALPVNLQKNIIPDFYISEKIPLLNNSVRNSKERVYRICRADIPAVKERRVNHRKTDDRAQENISSENPCSRNSNNYRKICKCRSRYHIKESVPVAVCKAQSLNLSKCFYKSHHKT